MRPRECISIGITLIDLIDNLMAKPHHFKSFSDYKINTRLHSSFCMPSKLSDSPSQFSRVFQSPAYCLSKLNNSKSTLLSSCPKVKIFKTPLKDSPFKNQSTEPSEERGKHLLNIENLLKTIESFTLEEKFRVGMEVLGQLGKINDQIGSIITSVREIIESYFKKLHEKGEEVNNLKSELNQDRQSLKILKKRFKKIAIENLSINDNYMELEDRYYQGKAKRGKMKNEIKFKDLNVLNLQNEIESLNKKIESYKRLGSKLRDITDLEGFLLFKERFKNETAEKDLDLCNFSSIDKNSDPFRKDSSKHIKSMSSSVIYF